MSMPGWQASQARRSQNGEVIGPLTGQIRLPEPCRIGPAGRRALRLLQRGLDLGLLGLEPGEGALELLALGAHGAQRARLVRARAVEPDPRVDEALLGPGDLVAALLDDRGDALLAALELVQARGGAPSRRPWRRATSLMMRWSCSDTRCMNSPRSSRSAKPLEDRITVTMSGSSAW